jgi:hypothetical protein
LKIPNVNSNSESCISTYRSCPGKCLRSASVLAMADHCPSEYST